MCSRQVTYGCSGGSKEVVSKDTNVEEKVVPVGNNCVEKTTITTTKTTFSDGSTSTKTETRTVTETRVTNRTSASTTTLESSSGSTKKKTRGRNKREGNETSSSSSSSSDSEDNDEFSAFEREALKAHNDYRKRHGAPPMKLNKRISQVSQNWANNIAARGQMCHSQGSGYGENIFWTSGCVKDGKEPVDNWYSEIKNHRFGSGGFQHNTGHFTQVVWKSSTELGIAKASSRNGTYVVANYNPPGNYQGQFNQNVLPPTY